MVTEVLAIVLCPPQSKLFSSFIAIEPIETQILFVSQNFLNSFKKRCFVSFSEGGKYNLPFEVIPPQYSGKNKNLQLSLIAIEA